LLSSKKQKSNPFQPGYGVMPPLLAGRNRLKQNFRDRLASIRNHECNPTAIVLMGPRGCGKTALLEWVSREAKGHKLPVVKLTKEDFVSITELQQVLYNLDMPVDRLKKISVQGRLGDPEGIAGIQADYTQQSERSRSVNQKLVEGLTRLSRKGLVLLVDEAHDMPPEVGKFFYDTTQYVGLNHPIMLVIAGTPDLKIVFACSHATFSERAQIERIGRLTKDEAREALTEPLVLTSASLPKHWEQFWLKPKTIPTSSSSGVELSGMWLPTPQPPTLHIIGLGSQMLRKPAH